MFLSDLSENVALFTQASFSRKRYDQYLRENKPEIYDALKKTRNELSDFVNKQRVNKSSKKTVIAVVIPKSDKNTYRMIRDMGMGKESSSDLRYNLRQLDKTQKRLTTPLSFSNQEKGAQLPRLETLERGRELPELGNIPPSKPRGKPSAPLAKTTNIKREMKKITLPTGKILAGLGSIAAVGGLVYYGLKKYNNNRNKKSRK